MQYWSNRLQLLDLPEPWQQLLREGGISLAAVDYLLPFRAHAGVLDTMLNYARSRWPVTLVEWRRLLNETVVALSRSLEPDEPTGPRFELTDDRLSRLQPIDLALSARQTVKRAMAVELWDQWQDEADAEPAAIPQDNGSNGNGQPVAASSSRSTAGSNGKAGRNGSPASKPHATRNPQRERELFAAARDFKAGWLRSLIVERLNRCDVDELEELAASLSIDVGGAWELQRPFLQLFQERELHDLAGELGVDVSQCADAGECMAVLLHARPSQIPQLLADC